MNPLKFLLAAWEWEALRKAKGSDHLHHSLPAPVQK